MISKLGSRPGKQMVDAPRKDTGCFLVSRLHPLLSPYTCSPDPVPNIRISMMLVPLEGTEITCLENTVINRPPYYALQLFHHITITQNRALLRC